MPLRGEAASQPTYLNLRPIGPGTSETFIADHDVFGAEVVQKTVPAGALVPDSVVLQEPRLLKNLDHEAIPAIHEAQYDPQRPGCITMVMEQVGTQGAGQVVLGQVPALSIGECVQVGLDLLGALDHLHVVARVLHRDLKPDNVRLSPDRRRGWLIDFNLAGQMTDDGTVTGVATPPAWMAPEVPVTGRYSVRSEIYSLGVVLYELLRGQQMLASYPHDKVEDRVTAGQRGFPNTHYHRWPPHVPAALRRIISKATAADPDRRWETAADMRTALGRLIYIDWRQDPQDGDRWVGTWPSTAKVSDRIEIEVTTRQLRGGPDRGLARAVARYKPGTDWRRLAGVDDRTLPSTDGLCHFFSDVETRLARLRPAV